MSEADIIHFEWFIELFMKKEEEYKNEKN